VLYSKEMGEREEKHMSETFPKKLPGRSKMGREDLKKLT